MIFVIMGMEVHPFDRLARAIDELQLAEAGREEYFIQLGSCTYEPKHARFERFLSFGDVCENVRKSSVVISHAGAGSTLVCIQQGKHPILVPRRSHFGEHVDEHQVPFAARFAGLGLATTVDTLEELPAAVVAVRAKPPPRQLAGGARELEAWLEAFWQGIAGRARA